MKKLILILFAIIGLGSVASAQKFALVDMEYVLSNLPAYEMANEQLNQMSQRWQKEVEAKSLEAETLYKNYQAEMIYLTDELKKQREEAIVAKEKEAVELRNRYFGLDGELKKKRESLMQPIQEDVYN
ncbi:MAG: OmpH family outer membrane protein, partial [Paramuribaculum sp.]|nr:OmpH family outer membrane protein [Paramuribaculum sp.]